ncbi:hypothetical protein QUA70_16655 [Microcoleus sp. LAD1_D5]|uniref:hypothetical protein n=1 Tax=unclassified Microcoleus TaxID=2642155 RepID=UPI002FD32F31
MLTINPESKNILILAFTGSILCGTWLAYKLKLFNFFSTINDEKKLLLPSFLFLFSPFILPFIFSHYMFPQSPGIYIILSAIVSGIMLLTSNFINNKFQLQREEKQRIWQEKSEQQKWFREKIYDSYKTSIQLLTEIIQVRHEMEFGSMRTQEKFVHLNKLYLEFNSEFEIIMIDYPDKDSEEFKEIYEPMRKYMQENPSIARIYFSEIMKHDSRIKSMNK